MTTALAPSLPANDEAPTLPRTREAWSHWAFMLPFAGRVFALQATHPTVSAGLEQHSTLLTATWERGWDTIAYGLKLIFDDTTATATEIRELHRNVKGVDHAGNACHAWNREPWAWIHLSTFDGTRYANRAIGRPLDAAAEAELYEEWKAAGRSYGVQERDIPPDLQAYNAYLQDMIDNRLVATPTSTGLLDLIAHRLTPPPWLPLPAPLWNASRPLTSRLLTSLLIGGFPPQLRAAHNIRWTPIHEAHYKATLAVLRASCATLPDRLTQFPAAYKAQRQQPR